jgi:hypothetical protein
MNKIGALHSMSLFLSVCLLSSCCSMSSAPPGRAAASMMQALPNAEYPIDVASSGKAQLKNGVFEETAVPGSATRTRISLGQEQAEGDLNRDGAQDAAVTLVADPGGSGTFTYLAAVINRNGAAEPIASVFLGDRIIVKSLAIESGKIFATLLTRKPDEPMAAKPTVEVKRMFKLRGDSFVEETGKR